MDTFIIFVKAVVCSSPNVKGYWNPSSLVDITESEIELMMILFAGLNSDQLSYAKVNESLAIGFMMLRFGIDDIMNTTNLIDNEGNIDYNNIELFLHWIMLFIFLRKRCI